MNAKDDWVFPWKDDPNYVTLARRDPSGVFYYREWVDGKLHLRSYRTKDADAARLAHVARFGSSSIVTDSTTIRGAQAFEEFIDRLEKRGRKTRSAARYRCSWKSDAADILGPMLVHKITPRDVLRVIDRAKARPKLKQAKKNAPGAFTSDGKKWYVETEEKLSEAAIKRLHACLSSFATFCCSPAVNYASSNFAALGVDTPPSPQPRATGDFVVFSDEEVDAIAEHVSRLDECRRSSDIISAYKRRTFVLLDPELGTRISELLAVQIEDIDFLRKRVMIDKQVRWGCVAADSRTWYDDLKGRVDTVGERPRWVPLSEFALVLLSQYIKRGREERWLSEGDGLLFPSMDGTPIQPSRISAYLKPAVEAVGKRVCSHYFRHTYVSNRYAAGVELEEIAEYIGADPKVVKKTYLHLTGEDAKHAAVAATGRKASALKEAI